MGCTADSVPTMGGEVAYQGHEYWGQACQEQAYLERHTSTCTPSPGTPGTSIPGTDIPGPSLPGTGIPGAGIPGIPGTRGLRNGLDLAPFECFTALTMSAP